MKEIAERIENVEYGIENLNLFIFGDMSTEE